MNGFSFTLDDESQKAIANAGGKIYVWQERRFSPLVEPLRAGCGCFVWMESDLELRLTGHLDEVRPLSPGWNMVFSPAYENLHEELLFLYNPSTKVYSRYHGKKGMGGVCWIVVKSSVH